MGAWHAGSDQVGWACSPYHISLSAARGGKGGQAIIRQGHSPITIFAWRITTHTVKPCAQVPPQMGTSHSADAGSGGADACEFSRRCGSVSCRWDEVGPAADARDGVPWCGLAGSRRARRCRRAEINHFDVASSGNTQSEILAQMWVIRSCGRSQRGPSADGALFGIVLQGYARARVCVTACMPWSACVTVHARACMPTTLQQ
jgi:hypothetical protein